MEVSLSLGQRALAHANNFASRFLPIAPVCTKYDDQVQVGGLGADDLKGTGFRSSSL